MDTNRPAAYLVRVSFSDHFLDLFVGEPLAEVHHAVLELGLADEPVTVAIKHSEMANVMMQCPDVKNRVMGLLGSVWN